MNTSMPLAYRVTFAYEAEGPVHAIAKAEGAPWAKARTLCGLPLDSLTKAVTWEVGREKTPGIPANPFFSQRGCAECGRRLSI